MRIVVFAGGTGSIQVQSALYHSVEKLFDGVDLTVLVNAYDNGLSTGSVRRVMDGAILGPSDVRKNQTTRLKLLEPQSPWLDFLSIRFTSDSSKACDVCREAVTDLLQHLSDRDSLIDDLRSMLLGAIDRFFSSPKAKEIEYEDFSLANIIYAGLARLQGDSLRSAAALMASAMGIPDNVLLNDDRSLFLGAVTRNGLRVSDEGEIVSWGNELDSFVEVFFSTADGSQGHPRLCLEAWKVILDADLILLSCGTQWSSLIPTYASDGFKSAIAESKATIIMIMNRVPDKDSPGQSASDIVKILVPRFFSPRRLHVISDKNSHPRMRGLDSVALSSVASHCEVPLSASDCLSDKYDPLLLANAIGDTLFSGYLGSDFYLFDYDDTLVGRNGKLPRSSRFNIESLFRLNSLTNVAVCTGNTISAIGFNVDSTSDDSSIYEKPLRVFADGGVNEYFYDLRPASSDRARYIRCLQPTSLLDSSGPSSTTELMCTLLRTRIPSLKVENRGNASLSVKPVPITYRHAVLSMLRHITQGTGLEVRETGTTTVEVCKPSLSKIAAINHIRGALPEGSQITFIGDECHSGNDQDIYGLSKEDLDLKCLHVRSPTETAFFIATLMRHLRSHE